jgi:hypothetical protein
VAVHVEQVVDAVGTIGNVGEAFDVAWPDRPGGQHHPPPRRTAAVPRLPRATESLIERASERRSCPKAARGDHDERDRADERHAEADPVASEGVGRRRRHDDDQEQQRQLGRRRRDDPTRHRQPSRAT